MHDRYSPIRSLSEGPASCRLPEQQRLPHVLLVVDGFPKTLGGGERVVLKLAAMLPRYGYRVSILTFALDPRSEFQVADAPCPTYLLPLQKTYDLAAWKGALALRRLLNGEQVQIVQTFFESSDIWAGVFARLLSPAKLIWSRRDMGILRGGKHTLAYRALRRLPHAVFAVSEQVRQHAITVDGISPDRVHTIYNGLDLTPGTPVLPLRTEGAVVTTVGNIRRIKGHDLFIRAAAEVVAKYPHINFTIAGEVLEPAYFEELQAMVRDLGLSERFHFLGLVKDLRAHLQTAQLFVLPSRSEGFSNALIEAMAAGLPCIATDVGGNAEAIQDGISGTIVAPEAPGSLASAMLEMFASPMAASQMGLAAQRAVEAKFTADAMAHKVARMYTALINSR